MKLYLSPSNQPGNRYVVGNTTEKEQMEAVALLVQKKLEDYIVEVEMADFSKGIELKARATDAKKAGADFYLALHSNAGGGGTATGAIGIYNADSKISKKLVEEIVKELDSICPIKSNRYVKHLDGMKAFSGSGYGEIRSPKQLGIASCIIEVNFHDTVKTAQYIIDNNEEIADAIVRGIVRVFDLKKKAVDEVKQEIGQVKYNSIEEVPIWYKGTIQKLIDKKVLQGNSSGDLGLSEDMCRVFTIHDRLGLYDK